MTLSVPKNTPVRWAILFWFRRTNSSISPIGSPNSNARSSSVSHSDRTFHLGRHSFVHLFQIIWLYACTSCDSPRIWPRRASKVLPLLVAPIGSDFPDFLGRQSRASIVWHSKLAPPNTLLSPALTTSDVYFHESQTWFSCNCLPISPKSTSVRNSRRIELTYDSTRYQSVTHSVPIALIEALFELSSSFQPTEPIFENELSNIIIVLHKPPPKIFINRVSEPHLPSLQCNEWNQFWDLFFVVSQRTLHSKMQIEST